MPCISLSGNVRDIQNVSGGSKLTTIKNFLGHENF